MIGDLLQVGDPVFIDAVDGFGGPGSVVEVREHPNCRCRVLMEDGSQPAFWAYDAELSPRAVAGPDVPYDSRPDTLTHIGEVRARLEVAIARLRKRQELHDLSKRREPEKSIFDEMTPKLRGSTYGSEEYKGFLKQMGEALQHHYTHNS